MTRSRIMPAAALTVSAVCVAMLPMGATDALAQGCAMCGTAVGEAGDPLARSMASSILFMLSMPFALFVSVGGWLAYRMRRDGNRREMNHGDPMNHRKQGAGLEEKTR